MDKVQSFFESIFLLFLFSEENILTWATICNI